MSVGRVRDRWWKRHTGGPWAPCCEDMLGGGSWEQDAGCRGQRKAEKGFFFFLEDGSGKMAYIRFTGPRHRSQSAWLGPRGRQPYISKVHDGRVVTSL